MCSNTTLSLGRKRPLIQSYKSKVDTLHSTTSFQIKTHTGRFGSLLKEIGTAYINYNMKGANSKLQQTDKFLLLGDNAGRMSVFK